MSSIGATKSRGLEVSPIKNKIDRNPFGPPE